MPGVSSPAALAVLDRPVRGRRLGRREILAMDDRAARRLWAATAAGDPAVLPRTVHQRLHRFAARGGPSNAVLLRRLLPEAAPAQDRAAAALRGAATVFGSPGPVELVDGRWPAAWHVAGAGRPDRARYVLLLCLDGPRHASIASATGANLAPIAQLVLREPRFVVGGACTALLSGGPDDLGLHIDPDARPAGRHDRQAGTALDHLRDALAAAALEHLLERGDLLVVDNRRAALGLGAGVGRMLRVEVACR